MKTRIGNIEFRLRFVGQWFIEARKNANPWIIIKSVGRVDRKTAVLFFDRFTGMMNLQHLQSAVSRRLDQVYAEAR